MCVIISWQRLPIKTEESSCMSTRNISEKHSPVSCLLSMNSLYCAFGTEPEMLLINILLIKDVLGGQHTYCGVFLESKVQSPNQTKFNKWNEWISCKADFYNILSVALFTPMFASKQQNHMWPHPGACGLYNQNGGATNITICSMVLLVVRNSTGCH